MKLNNLSEPFVKKFAGETIFGRGKEYFYDQMVETITYDPVHERIQAEVSGSTGYNYDVEIVAATRGIDATCSCPYEGYPCKHVVAVLLTYIKKKDVLLEQAAEKKKKISSLKERVHALSKNRLAEMLLSLAEKYPDCHRDLLIRMGDDPQEVISVIKKKIHWLFRAFDAEELSSSKVVKQLKGILGSVRKSQADVKAKVYWAISDRILKELNEYGMDDEPLEDIAIESLDLLADVSSKVGIPRKEKTAIVRALEKYSAWGNCGIIDSIDEAIEKIENL